MHFLSLSLLVTFSAHNFSAPITTVFPENRPNSASIVQFQAQYLTSFAQFKPSFEDVFQHNFENNTKTQIFEASKKSAKKIKNLQKIKQLNLAKEKLLKLSNFVQIYIKENPQFQPISSQISKILPSLGNLNQTIELENTKSELQITEQKESNNFQTLEKNNQNNTNLEDLESENNDEQLGQKEIESEDDNFWQSNLEESDNYRDLVDKNSEKIAFGPNKKDLKITELAKKITGKKTLGKILPKIPVKTPVKNIKTNVTIPNTLKTVQKPVQISVLNNTLPLQSQKESQPTSENENSTQNFTQDSNSIENSQTLAKLTEIPSLQNSQQNSAISQSKTINLVEKKQNTQESQTLEENKNSSKKDIPIPVPKNTQNSIQNTDLTQMIIEKCQKYGCDANRMLKVVKCESGGRNITGIGGHIGPFQFTNRTFYSFASKYGLSNPDIWNVSDQVEVATQMFAQGLGKQHWSCF